MQRVVRLSFAGLLAFAGATLTACGDKVTIPPAVNPPVDSVVHSVTVSPPSATIAIGGTITLGVSVDAGAGVTVRTVSWSSSDPAVATVGAADGKVTGVKAGTATIIAKSTKDPSVSGASGRPLGLRRSASLARTRVCVLCSDMSNATLSIKKSGGM